MYETYVDSQFSIAIKMFVMYNNKKNTIFMYAKTNVT